MLVTDDERLWHCVIWLKPVSVATKVGAPLSSRLSFSKSLDVSSKSTDILICERGIEAYPTPQDEVKVFENTESMV